MSNNKITMGISKSLPEMKDKAISLISALTGESAAVLSHKTYDQLLQHLSFLLKCEHAQVNELLREHDQNYDQDLVSLLKNWKLVAKGKINKKKKEFGSLENETYKYLKFLFARKGDEARFRSENNLGSATSDVNFSSINLSNQNVGSHVVSGAKLNSLLDKFMTYMKAANTNHISKK